MYLYGKQKVKSILNHETRRTTINEYMYFSDRNVKDTRALPSNFYLSIDRSKAILLLWFYCFVFWSRVFVLFEPYVCFHNLS